MRPPSTPLSSAPPVYSIPVGQRPIWSTYDPTNGLVYVSNSGSSNISVIEGTSIVSTISLPAFESPMYSTYDSKNGFVYVPDFYNNVTVLNGTTVVAQVNTGSYPLSLPYQAIYDSRNGYIYVTNCCQSNIVSVINGTKLIANVTVKPDASFGTVDDANGYIYLPSEYSSNGGTSFNVSVINDTAVISTIRVEGSPYAATYDRQNGYVYVTNGSAVSAINGTSLIASVATGATPKYLSVDVRTGDVYASMYDPSSPNSGSVSVIEGTKLAGSVSVGSQPEWSAYDEDTGDVYVPSAGSGDVTVIRSSAIVGTVNIGQNSTSATYDGGNEYVYLTDSNLHGGNVSVILTGYRLQFLGTGLPLGANWSVNLSGEMKSSNSTQITFVELNGSYSFTVGDPPGYEAVPSSGSISVYGSTVNETIRFVRTYPVMFTESGLPPGTTWRVDVSGGNTSLSQATTLSWVEPNGTYPYSVFTSDTTFSAPAGSFSVRGLPVSESVHFSEVTYRVSFTESGLANGTNWSVVLGFETLFSSNAEVNFSEPNGTYLYRVGTVPGWTTSRFAGSAVVSGTPVSMEVVWDQVTYKVTFSEGGLPTMTEWWVNGSSWSILSSASSTLSFSEPNGTYSYLVGTPDKTYAAPGGSFTVSGAATSASVLFSAVTYGAEFTETGLPAGTQWSVTLGTHGVTKTAPGNITFGEIVNNTYSFSVGSVIGFAATPDKGSLIVSGPPTSESIHFEPTAGSGNQTGSPTFLGLPLTEGCALLGGILLVLAISVAAIIRRRYREGALEAPDNTAEPIPGDPPE